jgi:hypothetical protein
VIVRSGPPSKFHDDRDMLAEEIDKELVVGLVRRPDGDRVSNGPDPLSLGLPHRVDRFLADQ